MLARSSSSSLAAGLCLTGAPERGRTRAAEVGREARGERWGAGAAMTAVLPGGSRPELGRECFKWRFC
eukprot:scaffold206606_cov18-Prasinocladus_malaysianus.AAC.1